jgi:hypothetical protein
MAAARPLLWQAVRARPLRHPAGATPPHSKNGEDLLFSIPPYSQNGEGAAAQRWWSGLAGTLAVALGGGATHTQAMNHRPAIEASLELAVSRIGDPQQPIYARLFALHPAMEAEFWRDGSGRIRGEMLARTFEMILDLAAPYSPAGGGWGRAFLGTEAVTHDAYGIDRAVFGDFLPVVAAVIRDACGDGFTPAMAAAWAAVLVGGAETLAALPGSSDAAREIDVDDILPPVGQRGLSFPMR